MKNILPLVSSFLLIITFAPARSDAQTTPKPMTMPGPSTPWADKELTAPSALAAEIKSRHDVPVILNIGAVEDIKGAKHIGPVSNTDNMEKLKQALTDLPKNKPVVIYCGCCPFAKCPNIRPAYNELKKEGFTDVRVLDLPVNLKTNWISPGYPLTAL